MRVLATRMRGYAEKTSQGVFRRKLEHAASELEEATIDVESRSRARRENRGHPVS